MNPALPFRLNTERLLLRCWEEADAPRVREAIDRSDAQLRPWIPFMRDEPRTPEATREWVLSHRTHFEQGEYFRFAVFDALEDNLLGENMLLTRVGPNAMEIGYLTFFGHEGRGIATEATAAMVRLAFDWFKVSRVEIHCAPENAASAAIPRRLGFVHEATLAERIQDTDGVVRDLMIWTLFARDYAASPASSAKLKAWDAQGERLF